MRGFTKNRILGSGVKNYEYDCAVMKWYRFPVKDFSEADCVATLMAMYQELTM
ncbi:MAG: hypothetical protein LBC96_04270 [Lachnospiraceae bacterium]|nr:hypothetical protein [Lachnospiraceae bacterium]